MLIIINILAPTEDKQLTVKERFYGTLQTVHNEIPRKDLLIITGDCNAKTGRDRCYRPVTGTCSLHEEHSENGEVLCLDAIETDMSTMSTYSQHETTQKGTWTVPDGHTINQIDHVTVNKKKSITIQYEYVRAVREPNCDSDNFLVKVMITQKLINNKE
jgi:hypothetical protein